MRKHKRTITPANKQLKASVSSPIEAAKKQLQTRGGGGSASIAGKNEYHPNPAPAASAIATPATPQHQQQPASRSAASSANTPHSSQQAKANPAIASHSPAGNFQKLPTGLLSSDSKKRLSRLYALYSELQHTERLHTYTSQYLPKLRATSGEYVTDTLIANRSRIKAEIATLAATGSTPCPPALKPSAIKR